MLIGGEDRGQVRLGLQPIVAEKRDAFAVAQGTAPIAEPRPAVPQTDDLQVVSASFAPEKPLMVLPVQTEVALTLPEAVEAEAAAPSVEELQGRLFYVDAPSVNVREGPGKDHAVLDRLPRGEAVLVLVEGQGPDGWSLVRVEGDGVEGYIASRLLTE
ncbi:MAG: SH3 domain-containing protein [Paracoccaceae bacterium]